MVTGDETGIGALITGSMLVGGSGSGVTAASVLGIAGTGVVLGDKDESRTGMAAVVVFGAGELTKAGAGGATKMDSRGGSGSEVAFGAKPSAVKARAKKPLIGAGFAETEVLTVGTDEVARGAPDTDFTEAATLAIICGEGTVVGP